MSRKLPKELDLELARLTKLARENERLLAQAILKIEDLHAANESLKSTIRQRTAAKSGFPSKMDS
jgi:uncharacterized protein YigA (DUF484 family)